MAAELTPRVGFIGSGWTERVQIPAFTAGGLKAQAIASANPDHAHRVAAKFDIPQVFDSWRDLIHAPAVDVVSIVTPPALHQEMAIAALEAGKHVICEKPMALTVAEAETMFAAAQAAPGQLAIIDHELRFHPARMQLRQMIKDGAVGTLLRIELSRLGPDRLNPGIPFTWWADATQGGGMLGAVGSHLLDLARWMVGRIDMITGQVQTGHYLRNDASGAPQQVTAEDHADILVRFANGAQGRLTSSGLTPGAYGLTTLAVGTEGAIRLDNQDHLMLLRGDSFPMGDWEPVRPKYPLADLTGLPANNPFAVGSFYLAQTLAAVLPMGETSLPEAASFYDGLVVQRALDAVRRSHSDATWVQL